MPQGGRSPDWIDSNHDSRKRRENCGRSSGTSNRSNSAPTVCPTVSTIRVCPMPNANASRPGSRNLNGNVDPPRRRRTKPRPHSRSLNGSKKSRSGSPRTNSSASSSMRFALVVRSARTERLVMRWAEGTNRLSEFRSRGEPLLKVPRSLSGPAIEVGLDSGPILVAPGLFGLRDQDLRNAAMHQHEFRSTIRRWRQCDRGHREDALGESAVAPGLNDASPGDEVDVDPGDITLTDGESPANLPADDRLPARERGVLSRVGQQIVDDRRIGLELHSLLDGLAHAYLPPGTFYQNSPCPQRVSRHLQRCEPRCAERLHRRKHRRPIS